MTPRLERRLDASSRSVFRHAANGASAVRRDHAAARSEAFRRPPHLRHALQGERSGFRTRTARGARLAPVADLGAEARRLDEASAGHDGVLASRGECLARRQSGSRSSPTRRLRPDSVVEAERDSLARLPYDAKRDEPQRNEADIFVVAVTGGQPRRVTTFAGNERDLALVARRQAHLVRVGADARRVAAHLHGRRRRRRADELVRHVAVRAGRLRVAADRSRSRCRRRSAVGRRCSGSTRRTKQLKEVLGGRRRLNGFAYDATKKMVAYVATSVDAPTELYVANADGTGERKLTTFNDKLNQRGRLVDRRAVHVSVRRWPGDRRLADEARGLRAGQEVSARALHPRRSALAVQRGLVRRVPESRRCRRVGAVHESARLERLRWRLHVRDARTLGRGGLRGSDEGRGHRRRNVRTSTRLASASPAARTAAS